MCRGCTSHLKQVKERDTNQATKPEPEQTTPKQQIQPTQKEQGSYLVLVTLAGNEYHMSANLAHCEEFEQLEDDVINFLPTVANVEAFGCEVELIVLDTKLPLRDPIQSTLRKHNRLQVIAMC